MIKLNKIYQGDALSVLKTFPAKIFNTCVTSPPYYGLRAYGTSPVIWDGDENCEHEWNNTPPRRSRKESDVVNLKSKQATNKGANYDLKPQNICSKCGAWRGELGSEPSPELFIKHLVDIFREVKRTLRDDGTIWVNMGDSYWGGKGQSSQAWSTEHTDRDTLQKLHHQIAGNKQTRPTDGKHDIIKPKDLIGIPWMLAFALRADGWYLRSDIIWYKRNPMPESVNDRPTKAHEYIFLLSKSKKYYYDALSIATPYKDKTYTTFGCQSNGNGDGSGLVKSENWANDIPVRKPKEWKTPDGWDTSKGSHGSFHKDGREKGKKGYEHRGTGDQKLSGHSGNYDSNGNLIGTGFANKRTVWDVPTMPFKEAHFATFSQELIVDCIKAGCPKGGIVLDPFGGANTTGVVSRKLQRNYVAIELNPDYIKIGEKREYNEIGLFI